MIWSQDACQLSLEPAQRNNPNQLGKIDCGAKTPKPIAKVLLFSDQDIALLPANRVR
jgi:hypothetical protein